MNWIQRNGKRVVVGWRPHTTIHSSGRCHLSRTTTLETAGERIKTRFMERSRRRSSQCLLPISQKNKKELTRHTFAGKYQRSASCQRQWWSTAIVLGWCLWARWSIKYIFIIPCLEWKVPLDDHKVRPANKHSSYPSEWWLCGGDRKPCPRVWYELRTR